MKRCRTCVTEKPLSDFARHKNTADGYRWDCKVCANLEHKQWREANKDQVRKSWRNASRRKGLRQRYGMTEADYELMVERQKNKCLICGNSPKPDGPILHVDHDHETGVVRGLLCGSCNTGIGLLRDSIENLEKAIEYLNAASSGNRVGS